MYIISKIIKWLKANPLRLVVSGLHATCLLVLTFVWLNLPITCDDEFFLIQMSSGIKRILFRAEDDPGREKFFFVNVAYDRELIPKLDENGFEIGNQDITSREKLRDFFRVLNTKPYSHRFVVCDVFFKDPSPHDESLLSEMGKMRNLLIPYHKNNSGEWETPIFPLKKGVADYTATDTKGTFLKFRLMEGEHKSIPLLMYEKLYGRKFRDMVFAYAMDGRFSLNSLIVDFRIRRNHMLRGQEPYPCVNLGELLRLPPDHILDMLKDRIVVIGDFQVRDMHDTVIGDMPGSLILMNAYLSLVNQDHLISPCLLAFLFLSYLMISHNLFYGKKIEERKWYVRIVRSLLMGTLITKLVNHLFLLGIISLISYFLFNVHINILIIAAYLTIAEKVAKRGLLC